MPAPIQLLAASPKNAAGIPIVGAMVHVRQRLYLVESAELSKSDGATLVGLSCVDDDAQDQRLDVLWEHELDAEVRDGEFWQKLAGRSFDPAKRFAAYLNTLRWNCVTSTDPKLLQSPFRAGIRLDPYQLEPLRKALKLPRVNLFIADDVGLGKTIEAGLIARELLLRKKVREIVVSCPPSMLLQWQEELSDRFGLRFEILDRAFVQKIRRERGFSINPWKTHSRFLISHKLLTDESYTNGLRDWLGDFRPGTLFILDEAHHAAPASGQKYAVDSQMTHAVRDLAPRFEHRLFLSATPHNGHSNSFSALLEILDPQRFLRGTTVSRDNREAVLVRRIKEDLRAIQGEFPERIVEQVTLDGLPLDTPELELARLLAEYRKARLQRLTGLSKRAHAASGLLLCSLQQRLFSSIEAFYRTLRVHSKTVERQRRNETMQTLDSGLAFNLLRGAIGSEDERAELDEQENGTELDAQVEAATISAPASEAHSEEQQLLSRMLHVAEVHSGEPDARVRHLMRWIHEQMCPGGVWNQKRVILFTEYEDTLRYLEQQLRAAIADTDNAHNRIATFRGSTSTARREEIKAAFNTAPEKHPVRILLATDAAREGLNLQAHCNQLFHFDVPWNPSRMEQRNGRIDRKLQPAKQVFCRYFVYAQRPEDRILEAVVRKTKTIREELGSLSQVIDGQVEDLLKRGIDRGEIGRMEAEIEMAQLESERRKALEEELESSRERQNELRHSIDGLRSMMESSERQIGLNQEHFRSAISCALEMLDAPPLRPEESMEGKARFILPKLDEIQSSWAETMDSLRTPRPREESIHEWRRNAPLRPVVFEDTGTVSDETVQLHLEQRVVQRLLGRFLSQGFVHHDLSRACLAQTRDAIPRVVLLGRLALYGRGAARLHEEIVPITARWIDPAIRSAPLAPYARETETKTLELLDAALLSQQPANETVEAMLRASVARDIGELLPYLQTRAEEYATDALAKLNKRGEDEAAQMRGILEEQRKHILVTTAKYAQTVLPFEGDERRQFEANQIRWTKRLVEIETELETEPERVREVYRVSAQRIEPVGIVYLWPMSSGGR